MARRWLFWPGPGLAAPSVVGFGFQEVDGSLDEVTLTFRNLADNADQAAAAGDLVIALLVCDASRTLNVPTNWTTLIAQQGHTGASNFRAMACYRRLTSQQASQAFTISDATGSWNVGAVVIRGSNASDPIDGASAAFSEGLSTAPGCPDLTAETNLCRVLRLMAFGDDNSAEDTGYPASHTGIYMRAGLGGAPTSQGFAHAAKASAGAVGSAAWTIDASERWLAATVAVKR